MRLGRSNAPDPGRIVSVPLQSETGLRVETLSWDEESGRIVMLAIEWDEEFQNLGQKKILIVDLL